MTNEPANDAATDAAARAGIDAVRDDPDPDDPGHAAYLALHEERLARQRLSAIEAGRRKGGAAGAAMAGAMLAVAEIYEGPPKEDAPVTVEASSDPIDVDKDGIDLTVGEVGVGSPALERLDPVVGDPRKRPQL